MASFRMGQVDIPEEGLALTLMGGGAKGAYHLGVWEVFRQLDIPVCAITGTSIGAIDGALWSQGNFDQALKAWYSVSMADVVKADDLADSSGNILDPRNIAAITQKLIRERGLDTGPLRETLAGLVNEEAIRASSIAFGVTAFHAATLSTREVFTDEIPEGQLIDYLMASACLPIFKPVVLGGQEFYDGGFGDNMPVRMLMNRGYEDILVVDIGGVGVVKPVLFPRAKITTLRHSMPLGGVLDLNHQVLDESRQLGRLDTLRLLGRLVGRIFFFEPEAFARMNRLFSRYTLDGLEEAGVLLGLDRRKAWQGEDFLTALWEAYHAYAPRYAQIRSSLPHENLLRELTQERSQMSESIGPFRLCVAMELLQESWLSPIWKPARPVPFLEPVRHGAEAMLALLKLYRSK